MSLLINPYAGTSGPTVTQVYSNDFSGVAAGDNTFLPATGWAAFDYDDGGHTFDSKWHSYNDSGSIQVLYCEDSSTHLVRDVGTEGMEVEADFILNTPGTDMIGGIVACVNTADPLVYVGYELAINATENKHVVYARAPTETDLFTQTSAGLVEGTRYNLRLRYYAGTLTAWFDGVLLTTQVLSGPQQAALGSGHTHGGFINFIGFNNYDDLVLRSVV
jgi:hypothetical protein